MLGVTMPMLHMLGSAVLKHTAGRLKIYMKKRFTKSAKDSPSCPPVLPGAHAVQVPLGLEVYLVVEGDHDQHWQPERDAGRHDGVGRVDNELALLWVLVLVEQILVGRVPAEEDGQKGDAGGRQPGQEDHHHRRSHRDRGVVHQGLGNRVISKKMRNISKKILSE